MGTKSPASENLPRRSQFDPISPLAERSGASFRDQGNVELQLAFSCKSTFDESGAACLYVHSHVQYSLRWAWSTWLPGDGRRLSRKSFSHTPDLINLEAITTTTTMYSTCDYVRGAMYDKIYGRRGASSERVRKRMIRNQSAGGRMAARKVSSRTRGHATMGRDAVAPLVVST